MLIPTAGGVARPLSVPGPSTPTAEHVQWSADGKTVYIKAHDAEGRTSFWGVSPTGGAARLLVHFSNPDRQSNRHDFAMDGQRFYFTIEERQADVFVAELISK